MEDGADPRRHVVLAAFCFQNFMQCFCFLDFSTDATLVQNTLKITSEAETGLLYYGGFASTLPAMIASLALLLRGHEWTAGLAMSLLIVAGAWLRYAAALAHSYGIALLSTVVLGLAGGVIFTSFTFLPERWFPPHERAFATALAAQSNYAGWAAGCLTPLMFGRKDAQGDYTEAGFLRFLFGQALVASIALPVQLLANSRGPSTAHQAAPPNPTASAEPSSRDRGVGASLAILTGRPQYLIHSICYATLGAVGYAVTGVVDECFSAALDGESFSPDQTMWLNVAFVASGVLTGLVAGGKVPPRHYGLCVRLLFAVGALALLVIQLLLLIAQPAKLSKDTVYGLLIVLLLFAGAGTLGFVNIGLRVAVAHSAPVDEVYAGSTVEFFLLAIAASLGLLTYVVPAKFTFCFFAGPALLAALGICTCARFHGIAQVGDVDGPALLTGQHEVRSDRT